MNLQEQGFRFILRGDEGLWLHPMDVLETDTDCTDMDDDEFFRLAAKREFEALCGLSYLATDTSTR